MVEEDETMVEAEEAPQVSVFIDSDAEVFINSYDKILDEKYKDRPEDRPSDTNRIDTQCWAIAGGVPNRGRVRGVSRDVIPQTLGFHTLSQVTHQNETALFEEAMATPIEELRKELKEYQKRDNEKDAKITQLEGQNNYIINYLTHLFPHGFGMSQNGAHFGIPPMTSPPLQMPLSTIPLNICFLQPHKTWIYPRHIC